MCDGFVNAFVGVLQLDVFADDADVHPSRGGFELAHHVAPRPVGPLRRVQVQQVEHDVVQLFLGEHQRQLVN
ncbi:hypothetical protein D3C83_74650 [compost metagenome]